MTQPETCLKEEVLLQAAKAGGIAEIIISSENTDIDKTYHLSVKIKSTSERFYLATRRNPNEPRVFKHVDGAISVANKLFAVKTFTIVIKEDR
jgi:hypothetical protein